MPLQNWKIGCMYIRPLFANLVTYLIIYVVLISYKVTICMKLKPIEILTCDTLLVTKICRSAVYHVFAVFL